jgi:signal transduction histidine kinase
VDLAVQTFRGVSAIQMVAGTPDSLHFMATPYTKRSDRRFIVNQPAQLTVPDVPGEVWEARIRDISRRGMQFTLDRPVVGGTQLRITWNAREISGTVRYQQRVGDEIRLGVELTSSWDSLVSDVLAQQAEELQASNFALRQTQAALTQSNKELGLALDLAREASQAKSRFLASVSHELRTPLNGIIGFSQLLHDGAVGPVTGDQRECLEDVLNCSNHLLALIDHVLDLTKIEAGKMEFEYQAVSLQELAAGTIDSVKGLAAAKSIDLRLRVDEGLAPVQADASRLRQVMLNYLSNALKFTGAGGTVSLEISEEAGGFRIVVSDTGIGIRPEDLARLFTEFGQLGAAEKAKSGTGLGLAITKRIVEAQGGSVGVESVFGQGSRFWAVLPG